MGSEPTGAPVRLGDVVAGKYRIDRILGSGGMGVVFAAHHLALDEPVALKFIRGLYQADREIVERTMREARATFRLRSAHTVRVLDIDEMPSGAVYIVMELLEGHDLRAELNARGPLPESEVATYIVQVCDALGEAHELGIIHRDLKPENLFLARSARGGSAMKILDFGTSKLDSRLFSRQSLTSPDTVLGSPRYMAPEQWRAAQVDARTDIWSLGIVMYELLVGKAPLLELEIDERRARMLAGAFPSPRETRPDVSEEVSRIVTRCLRADPEARWPSATHLATALRDAHPDVAPTSRRAEVTRTDTTVVVPPQERKQQVAAAFGSALPSSTIEPESTTDVRSPPAQIGTPEAPAEREPGRPSITAVSPGQMPTPPQKPRKPVTLPVRPPRAHALATRVDRVRPVATPAEPLQRSLLIAGAVIVAIAALAIFWVFLRWLWDT